MPITLTYNPDFLVGGRLAHEAGRGQFLQEKEKFDYQRLDADRRFGLAEDQFGESQRQFDESLAQRGSQFDRNLEYQVGRDQLQNSQFQQGLGLKAYQFDRQARDRRDAFGEEMDLRNAQIEAAERNRMRELDAARMARERADLKGVQERLEQQQFGLAMQELNRLEEAREKLSPAQYDQAKEQWIRKHGRHPAIRNQYPADLPLEPATPEFDLDVFKDRFAAMGEGYIKPEEMGIFTEEKEDGRIDFLGEGGIEGRRMFNDTKESRKEREMRLKIAEENNRAAIEKEQLKREAEIEKEGSAYQEKMQETVAENRTSETERFIESQKEILDKSTQGFQQYASAFRDASTEKVIRGQAQPMGPKPDPREFGMLQPVSRTEVDAYPPGTYFVVKKPGESTTSVWRVISPGNFKRIEF